MSYRSFVLVGLMLGMGIANLARAQSDAAIVCGKTLSAPGTLSWLSYLQRAADPTQQVDHDALAAMVHARSISWPTEIRHSVAGALQDFKSGDMPATALRITKTASLPVRQMGFQNTAYVIELPPDATARPCANAAEAAARIDAAYVIVLMERAQAAAIQHRMKLAADEIGELEQQYDRYLFEGFPMFPWEAWLNGKFLASNRIARGPPRNSIVFLHPAAGVVGSVESGTQSDVDGTLGVEALGWIRYDDSHRNWYGVSLLATFPTDREPGYGVAFNYNIYKVGATWHDDKGMGHDGWALYLGMDFLQFVNEKYRTYDAYREKVTKGLSELGQ